MVHTGWSCAREFTKRPTWRYWQFCICYFGYCWRQIAVAPRHCSSVCSFFQPDLFGLAAYVLFTNRATWCYCQVVSVVRACAASWQRCCLLLFGQLAWFGSGLHALASKRPVYLVLLTILYKERFFAALRQRCCLLFVSTCFILVLAYVLDDLCVKDFTNRSLTILYEDRLS